MASVCSSTPSTPVDNLVFAFSIFRHGERGPLAFIEDENPNQNRVSIPDESKNHCGNITAELTNVGKQQAYDLGEWYASTYRNTHNLLPKEYKRDDIYVYSTDTDRTLMSAECVLAGLYPPVDNNVGPEVFKHWQPIPVHTKSSENDELFPSVDALNIGEIREDWIPHRYPPHLRRYEVYLEKQALWQKWYAFYYGDTGFNFRDVILSGDNRQCAMRNRVENIRLPPNFDVRGFANHVQDMLPLFFEVLTPFKIMGYQLLKMVDDAMNRYILEKKPKMCLYSLHDLNIFTAMGQLNLEVTEVGNCACLTFELHEASADNYVVKLRFKPGHQQESIVIKLENKYFPPTQPQVVDYTRIQDFKSMVESARVQHEAPADPPAIPN